MAARKRVERALRNLRKKAVGVRAEQMEFRW